MEKTITKNFCTKRGTAFTIVSGVYDSIGYNFLAMQNLTETEKNNPDFLREVYVGETLKEVKANCENGRSFYQ